jgi:hypothetical protein
LRSSSIFYGRAPSITAAKGRFGQETALEAVAAVRVGELIDVSKVIGIGVLRQPGPQGQFAPNLGQNFARAFWRGKTFTPS